MNDVMSRFKEVVENRHDWIRSYKAESGRKIAGYFCDYLPEEVLWAGGLVPVRITGGRGNVVAADRYLQSNVCSFARRCFDQALNGVYDYLDAVAIPHTCDVITKMYDLWAYRMPTPEFVHYFWLPHKVFTKDAVTVMLGEVKRLRSSLASHLGAEISDDALKEAIAVYNRSRNLLRKVYELRRSSPPLLSGEDAFAVSLSSVLMPKDLHSQWVEELLKELEGKPSPLADRPRVAVAASALDDLEIMRAVEEAGAWVVADDVCTGSRYFFDRVDESEPDPVKSLTRRYLEKLPCPRSVDSLTPRYDHLLGQAREYQAGGVIFYILRCCDAHLFQYPLLKDRLEKEGLRTLYLQGDQTVGVNEQIINRIKAFTEMLST